jgi:hypothetical protein
MGIVMTVAMGMVARLAVRVGMARGVGVGVHRYQVYSTSLLPPAHAEVLSCYWKL